MFPAVCTKWAQEMPTADARYCLPSPLITAPLHHHLQWRVRQKQRQEKKKRRKKGKATGKVQQYVGVQSTAGRVGVESGAGEHGSIRGSMGATRTGAAPAAKWGVDGRIMAKTKHMRS